MKTTTKRPNQRTRHVPLRTCIACRQSDSKRSLLRLVRTAEGRIERDTSGKQPGRGAYLCQNPACWRTALRRKSLERALKLSGLHEDDYAMIQQFALHLEETMDE